MMSRTVIVISICLVVGTYGSPPQRNNPLVTAPAGTFEGSLLTSRLGKTIYSFRGIRYAEPPVGELRFKVSYFQTCFDVSQLSVQKISLILSSLITGAVFCVLLNSIAFSTNGILSIYFQNNYGRSSVF